jgi:hypothetical protein
MDAYFCCRGFEIRILLADEIEIFLVEVDIVTLALFSAALFSFSATFCSFFNLFVFVDDETFPDLMKLANHGIKLGLTAYRASSFLVVFLVVIFLTGVVVRGSLAFGRSVQRLSGFFVEFLVVLLIVQHGLAFDQVPGTHDGGVVKLGGSE